MPRYADVALPVGIEREFTYTVPPDLEPSVAIGVRVVVPFGRKLATGLIVSLSDTTSVQGLKPLRDILDARPLISPSLMRLCRWVAGYYVAPLGEVLKAANPGAFVRASRRKVTLASPLPDAAVREIERRSPKRARIVRVLQEPGTLTSSELQRLTGISHINP